MAVSRYFSGLCLFPSKETLLELYHVGLDVSVVGSKALDAVGVHCLLTNPHQRLALLFFVERDAAGDHLLPRLGGIAAVGEEQHVLAILAGDLHSAQSVTVAGDVNHLDAAVAEEVERLAGRALGAVPVNDDGDDDAGGSAAGPVGL